MGKTVHQTCACCGAKAHVKEIKRVPECRHDVFFCLEEMDVAEVCRGCYTGMALSRVFFLCDYKEMLEDSNLDLDE